MKKIIALFLSFFAMILFISCGETYDLEWVKIESGYYHGNYIHRFWILSDTINHGDDEYEVYYGKTNPLDGEGFCSWIDSALPSTQQLAYAASVAKPLRINTDTEMIADGSNDSSKYSFRCAYECREDGDCVGNRRCQDHQCILKCADGQHDGGDGICRTDGECSEGFHNGGDGDCLKNSYCSDGYHDGGDGICLKGHDAFSGCSTGYHNSGNGICVRNGICSIGYHDGGNGVCVRNGTCSSGYHDGGDGTCREVLVSVRIPAGSFKSSRSNTTVYLSAFKLAKTPTTVAQFKQCVDDGKCSSSHYIAYSVESLFCNYNRGSSWKNHPMNCVNWDGAKAFCEWAGGRLPTEDEWEYAATHNGSKALQTTYPWGNAAPRHCENASYRDEASDTICNGRAAASDENAVGTSAVGTYSPEGDSPLGLQDMAGNVFQWTSTFYLDETSSGYILQGSGWTANIPTLRIGYGFYFMEPTGWHYEDGFRCAFSE